MKKQSNSRLPQFRRSGSIFSRFVRYSICMIALPTLMLMLLVIFYYRYENMNIEKARAQEYLSEMHEGISRNMEQMHASARTLLSDSTLQRVINQSVVSQEDLLSLKRYTVSSMQGILSVNSDLHAVRFFYVGDNLAEISSCIYPISHLPEETIRSGREGAFWNIGQTDSIEENRGSEQMALLYMPVYTLDGVFSGLIEVGMQMNRFMSDMSIVKSGMLCGYMTDTNIMYYTNENREYAFGEKEWSSYLQEIRTYFSRYGASFTGTLGENGYSVYGCTKPISSIGGQLFCVTDISETVRQSNMYLMICIGSVVLFIMLALLITSAYTSRLLRRMYLLIYGMQQVEHGNLDVHMDPGKYNDEFSELSRLFNQMSEALKVLNTANAQKQELATRSEVRALQNQINAHFLYNTLETIRMMAYIGGNEPVAQAIAQLGSIFRYAMHTSDTTVTVKDEIENIRTYMKLMELQLDYSVELVVDAQPLFLRQEISRLSLQPIIENAILHGLNPTGCSGRILLRCAKDDEDAFTITVTDYGVGMEEETVNRLKESLSAAQETEGMSIGLQNVNNRIKLRFGDPFGVYVESIKQKYTSVILRLPLCR